MHINICIYTEVMKLKPQACFNLPYFTSLHIYKHLYQTKKNESRPSFALICHILCTFLLNSSRIIYWIHLSVYIYI